MSKQPKPEVSNLPDLSQCPGVEGRIANILPRKMIKKALDQYNLRATQEAVDQIRFSISVLIMQMTMDTICGAITNKDPSITEIHVSRAMMMLKARYPKLFGPTSIMQTEDVPDVALWLDDDDSKTKKAGKGKNKRRDSIVETSESPVVEPSSPKRTVQKGKKGRGRRTGMKGNLTRANSGIRANTPTRGGSRSSRRGGRDRSPAKSTTRRGQNRRYSGNLR